MKPPIKNIELEKIIFDADANNFTQIALQIFQFQYQNNEVYKKYCNLLNTDINQVNSLKKIPFLPIQFFKSQQIKTTNFKPAAIFESSGTTSSINSQHFVKNISLYQKSFLEGFNFFYGNATNYCILGLLPNYLERKNSSLVFMVKELIKRSNNNLSGFYLHDYKKLYNTILQNELKRQPTLLIGVTYALLNFVEKYPMQLHHTIIMETGGMKGRQKEITREEVHQKLKNNLGVSQIHSEYGMTELLSQAYALKEGNFNCVPWMKILIRDEDDPFAISESDDVKKKNIAGAINVIDLANLYSCSFIATDDIGVLHKNQSFKVLGRIDNSDLRGCSLLTA